MGADVTLRFGRIAKLKDKDGTASDQVIVKFVKESGLTTAIFYLHFTAHTVTWTGP